MGLRALFLLSLLLPALASLGWPRRVWAEAAGEGLPGDELPSPEALAPGGALVSDGWEVVRRIPSVCKAEFLTWEGLRIFLFSAPVLGASFIEERSVSDFFRDNRIGKDTLADDALDLIGGKLYPMLPVPLYALARGIGDRRTRNLALDLATFTLVAFPQLIALRYMGDRPRPDGSRGLMFGLDGTSSFPSGHTLSAVGVARLADYHYGHWVGVPLYLLAAAIGYQRLGSGDHYLADVVGGAILGFGVADAIVRERRRERKAARAVGGLSLYPAFGGPYRMIGLSVAWAF